MKCVSVDNIERSNKEDILSKIVARTMSRRVGLREFPGSNYLFLNEIILKLLLSL